MIEKVLLRMPGNLKGTLRREAKRLGISLNALILQILWNYCEEEME